MYMYTYIYIHICLFTYMYIYIYTYSSNMETLTKLDLSSSRIGGATPLLPHPFPLPAHTPHIHTFARMLEQTLLFCRCVAVRDAVRCRVWCIMCHAFCVQR